MNIQLGKKIKELRKAQGLTQDALAEKLGVSAQAVSKWENGDSFPDITMIPVLANFFKVSLDTLFNYDAMELEQQLDAILKEACKNDCFWKNPEKCEKILLDALEEYPCNDKLLRELLSLYECNVRSGDHPEYAARAEKTAKKLLAESSDIFYITSAKSELASVYKETGRYEEAKKLVDTLPTWYPYMLNDKMRTAANVLEGKDRLDGAHEWKIIEIQELYIACEREAEAYIEMGEWEKALPALTEAKKVLEAFMKQEEISPEAYLWAGMQTHHWWIYLHIAGILMKLGRKDEVQAHIDRAHHIIKNAWGEEYESTPAYFFRVFEEEYEKLGLSAFAPCPKA